MKKFFTFLIMAFVALGMSAQSLINVSDASIADWDKLPSQYVTSMTCATNAPYTGLKSAKVYADQTYLNVLIEVDSSVIANNNLLPLSIFINTDNSSSTGGNSFGLWENAYGDILIEGYLKIDGSLMNYNPSVFTYAGEVGADEWNFNQLITNYDDYPDFTPINAVDLGHSQKVGDFFEIQIDRSLINVTWDDEQFTLGIILCNEGWDETGILPNTDMVGGSNVPVPLSVVNINSVSGIRTATINNITYSLAYPDASVIAGDSPYSGNVIVPSTITLNDSVYTVTQIGTKAFENCSSLQSVTLPSSITSIGLKAFYNCYNLTTIICKAITPPSCGNNCFYNVPSSVMVYVPNQSVKAYQDASGWRQFSNYNSDVCGDNLRWAYTDGILTITGSGDMYDYYDYNSSYNSKYKAPWSIYADSITQVVMGNNVTSIGDYAFYKCKNLPTISIGKNVTKIGDDAFCFCSSLVSIVIPVGVDSIGNYAFSDCEGLKSLEVKNSNARCGHGILMYCKNIETIIGPADILNYPNAYIPDLEYQPHTATSITITGGELDETGCVSITNNYKHLKTLDVSATSNTTLSDEAFKDCYNLESIKLPSQIQYIPYMALAGCVNLKSVVIPASVVDIDQRAFEDCRSLSSVTFAGTSIQRIGSWAFYNAHQLTSLTLPQGVEEIGDGAFYGCTYLKNLQAPSSVRKMGDNCFALCNKLEAITITAAAPPTIEARTFYDVERAIPVYVPMNSLTAYKTADIWKDFTNIRTLAAQETVLEDTAVVVEPDINQVVITWPKSDEAATYNLVLYKNSEQVCTITFNSNGQLLTIAYAAPTRGVSQNVTYATDMITGYQFAITGLEAGVDYTYVITIADDQGQTIPSYCYSDQFRTKNSVVTSVLSIQSANQLNGKFIRNGQLYILRDGKTYNAQGGEVIERCAN